VELAKDVKGYAETAIRLDKDNFRAWHILGRWNYEVSNLNIAEKSFARLFYGKIPSATLEDAVFDFEKSRLLNPAFLLNYLELAKCYQRKGDDKKAIATLQTLLSMPNSMYDDIRAKTIARKLLSEWQ
jgi:tetratricopeptide (TPR) repeat protein